MKNRSALSLLFFLVTALWLGSAAFAQGAGKPPPDPWPRVVDLSNGQVLVYQPQVNTWIDNQIDFRAALAIKPSGAKEETFGSIVASARTQVDKVLRTVTFENMKISKIDFPTLPERGAAYSAELQTEFGKAVRTISLDRLEASLALAGIKPPTVAVHNDPPLSQVVNSSEPVIQVAPNAYYGVVAGVWFTAPGITGPWTIATSVPPVIYTIPPSSPLFYVTYVKIYEATPQYVYTGYTPGYLGTVVSPYGTVVYGTGYTYNLWIGGVWYAPPYTYGVAAAPIYNPWVGYTFGFAMGLATAASMEPLWGGAYYHPGCWGGYGCCGVASANVYGHWGNATYSGTRSWYAGGGVAGSTFRGSYATARGTTGNIDAGRQYNAWTGNATPDYDRSFNTAAGGYGNVARASNVNTYTGQRSTGSAVSATGPGGSTYDRAGATTAGPQGFAHAGGGSTYNARTGQTNTWSTGSGAIHDVWISVQGRETGSVMAARIPCQASAKRA